MKITRRKLIELIREEARLVNELDDSFLRPGVANPHSSERKKDTQLIEAAIVQGEELEKQLNQEMRTKAISDFSRLYADALQSEMKALVERNPDILSQDDLSKEKIKSIKASTAVRTVSEYKKKYTNTVLLSEHLARIERAVGKPIPPTLKQIILRYAKDFAYQFVFGMIDNLVLILAGAAIDDYIKIAFGAEKLRKALTADDLDFITDGVGNAISDGVGDLGGGAVEKSIESWKWMEDAATDNEMEIATPMQKLMAGSATFVGVVLGCLVAIPMGILILKGLTAAGIAATAGFSAASTWASAGLGIVALGLMGATTYKKFKMLDEQGQSVIDNALKRVMSAVYKHKRLAGETVPPIDKYGKREFTSDLSDPETREVAQGSWTREMDFADLASYDDAGKNKIWTVVDMMSREYDLDNPNKTTIMESRWQTLAGVVK